ncbi:MAG: thiol-disulfide isomerase [Bryobacteraceae bacterium]
MLLARALFAATLTLGLAAVASAAGSKPTFHKDVEPLLQKNCQSCHRPGEVAPMSFLSYKETRPWAKAMKQAVSTKKMPPWFADARYGKFHNDPRLSEEAIHTISAWADSGAPEGNPKDAPKPMEWTTGWAIPQPDAILKMPVAFKVPASGTVEYQNIVVPTNFTEDKWIQMAEARPGNRAITHHIVAFIREPGSKYMDNLKPGEFLSPRETAKAAAADRAAGKPPAEETRRRQAAASSMPTEILVGYAPGTDPIKFGPGQAKLLKKGSALVFQLHYTPNGKEGEDISEVGLVFAKGPVTERVITSNAGSFTFAIPPGDPNYEVKASVTIQTDARLIDFNPHMHLRGKDFEYKIVYPNGESEVALKVNYDFNWQLYYRPEKPIVLPAGTRIDCVAHFDNSANNPANPDPKATVRWGDQSWEEMMFGWFNVAIDVNKDPMDLRRPKKSSGGAEE